MEEKKTTNVLNLINPKKKTSAKKTTGTSAPVSDKDAEAKAKVEELLKNTSVPSLGIVKVEVPKQEYDIEGIKQEKSTKWLEDQLNLMNRQVEEQEQEILFYKNEIQRLQANQQAAGGVPAGNGIQLMNNDLPPGVVALFRHFEQVYEKGYTQTKIAWPRGGTGVLDMLLHFFPALSNVKRYKYRPEEGER